MARKTQGKAKDLRALREAGGARTDFPFLMDGPVEERPAVTSLGELASEINSYHAETQRAVGRALECARKAGEALIRAKGAVEHGEWGAWVAANFEGSARTARRYMRIAEGWPEIRGKTATVADLGIREAVKMLSATTQPPATTPDRPDDLKQDVRAAETAIEAPAPARNPEGKPAPEPCPHCGRPMPA